MSRVTLALSMRLLSDAIFGSGFSIPGGEDIAVCQDGAGYPYLKGSTLKGLLRESLENLADWCGAGQNLAEELLGAEGWTGTATGRRVLLTSLTLAEPPADPTACYAARTFTSLEDGVVKNGTLRTAACICGGLRFEGALECDEQDLPLLQSALAGIKWMGTLRSRGFGRVCLTAGPPRPIPAGRDAAPGQYIHYQLHSELPLILTDPVRSADNFAETLGFIPGSAVRGAVLSRLAETQPAWFEANRPALLGDGVRFLDALPSRPGRAALPAIQGFYEDKQGKALDENLVVSGGRPAEGHKRARLGSCCAPDPDTGTLYCWSAGTGGVLRIRRGGKENKQMFSVRYLEPGQDFEGCIRLDDPALAPQLAAALGDTLWLGADRYAGFGKCTVRLRVSGDPPAWEAAYGYGPGQQPGTELYLLALSALTMLDGQGEPCGLDEARLAQLLGAEQVELLRCSSALTQNGGYNRTWQGRAPTLRMYERGSLFLLRCRPAPQPEVLRQVQARGLGVRRAEGFGQVLFVRPEILTGLRRKQALPAAAAQAGPQSSAVRARQAGCRWLAEHADAICRIGVSKSQLGTVQSICETGSSAELRRYLDKNLNERGVEHGARFKEINSMLIKVLERPLSETLGVPVEPDNEAARLRLLCALFDHSRKGKEG